MSIVPDVSTKRTARRVAYVAVAAALLGVPIVASAQQWLPPPPTFSLKTTVTITGDALGSFDISWVNPEVHAYTLSDRSNKAVDVIDTFSKAQRKLGAGEFAGNVPTCPFSNACNGPNGNLSFNNNGVVQVWAGDGPTPSCTARQTPPFTTVCSTVKVLDFATGTVLHNIPTGGQYRADELCYDPADHLIQIANDSDLPFPYINYIPTEGPNAYTVVKQIKFDGAPGDGPAATNGIEQCKWNPRNGMIYLNIPEVNGDGNDDVPGHTVVIDPKTMTIVKQFVIPIDQCAGPQGMALGPGPEIMLGCNAKGPPEVASSSGLTGSGPQNTVVIDENDGHVIRTLANQGGNDEVWFNPGDGLYFLAEGQNAAQEQIGVVSSFPIAVTQDIFISPPATGRAHSVAADPILNEVYVPIPDNAASTICPTPADGCVAVFGTSQPPHFVYRGH
jgi:hypothetical protein